MLAFRKTPYLLLYLFFELLGLAAAWFLTFSVRLAINPWMPQQLSQTDLERAAPPLAGIVLLWVLTGLWRRESLYRRFGSTAAGLFRFSALLEAVTLAGATAIVATFFWREFGANLSRSFIILFVPISLLTLMLAHAASSRMVALTQAMWPGRERVAVVGSGPDTIRVINCMRAADLGLDVAGIILPGETSAQALDGWMPVLGRTSQLAEVINREQLDRIVIADEHITARGFEECARVTKRMGVAVTHAIGTAGPDAALGVRVVSDMHLLELLPVHYTRKQERLKRAVDIVLAGASLIVLSPALAVIAALIKTTSKGPLLYKSKRVGRGGRHFTFLKFRSMRVDPAGRATLARQNEKRGHIFKIRNDPRVTPVGRILRRYSLDELPQLVNVLCGEMSMVGPRPLPAEDLDADGQSKGFERWARERSQVLPGITGLWQIRGRSDLDFEQMVELDTLYIRRWSLGLDLRILLETPVAVFSGRGAY
jgi:exopolysaccharide biosynthesis polyprenyl glycosylphosphotransferase